MALKRGVCGILNEDNSSIVTMSKASSKLQINTTNKVNTEQSRNCNRVHIARPKRGFELSEQLVTYSTFLRRRPRRGFERSEKLITYSTLR